MIKVVTKALMSLVIILVTQDSNAQTILTNTSSTDVPTCTAIQIGTSMTFEISDLSCGYGIAVDFDSPGSPISDGTSDEQIALFYEDGMTGNIMVNATSSLGYVDVTTNANQFTLTFNELGTVTFQCDVPATPIFGVAGIANQCFTVVAPSTIPTLGEWGLIILGLVLSVVGVIFFRSSILATEKV